MWPPDQRCARFDIGQEILVEAVDQCSLDVVVRIASVVSDQPDQGGRFGSQRNDAIFSDTSMCLRAERFAEQRNYTVTVEAVDASDNIACEDRIVRVPLAGNRDAPCPRALR
jgi:hypothetical protein